MDVIIRQATEKDFDDLYDMICEFAEFVSKSDKMKITKRELLEEQKHFVCFLAEIEQKEAAGYIFFFPTFHTWSGKAIFLDDLYVREDYRRLGVGSRLLNAAIDHAKETGCTKVRWQVYDWNKDAIAMYEKMGARVGDNNLNCELDI